MSFYEGDYDWIKTNNKVESKVITERKSLVHYIKPSLERVFITVEIPEGTENKESLIEIIVFNEKHLDKNPYTELNFLNFGNGNV